MTILYYTYVDIIINYAEIMSSKLFKGEKVWNLKRFGMTRRK